MLTTGCAAAYGWQAAEKGYIGICWLTPSPSCRRGGEVPYRYAIAIISHPSTPSRWWICRCRCLLHRRNVEVNRRLAGRGLPVDGGFRR
ncbi:hypothetical protein KCP73_13455 [Salmonella enterica subsp. enterica]|nr:hypothetical protein KCP73_13455 [Salmonella enterica subsp. enterica]